MPHSSATPSRTDATILADELPEVADLIKWSRVAELKEFGAMADRIIGSGYYGIDQHMGASPAERTPSYKVLAGAKPAWAHLMRKTLDSRSPPAGAAREKATAYKEIDIFATIQSLRSSARGRGNFATVARSRLASFFREIRAKDAKLRPHSSSFLQPKLKDDPWAIQDPARKRAARR